MTLRYPAAALVSDHVRAGAGLVFTAGPALLLDLPWPALAVFVPAAALFAAFALQSQARRRLRIRLDREAVTVDPGGRRLRLSCLDAVTLSYFSVRRDGERGWFELELRDAGARLCVDSRLEGFALIAGAAARAAGELALPLDRATRENFAACGCRVEADERE